MANRLAVTQPNKFEYPVLSTILDQNLFRIQKSTRALQINRQDIIKATLQSLAYQTRDVVSTMQKDTGIDIKTLRVDGGAANNNYLMQFQADILNSTIEKAGNLETTAMGAAFLAGLAVGFWQDTDELAQIFTVGQRFEPAMPEEEREDLYAGWQQAVEATKVFKHRPYKMRE